MSDVFKRITHNLKTGHVIDECVIDDVPDAILHRPLAQPTDIRVELIMKGALKMFETKNVDVAEVFSPPRVAQEAVMSSYDGARLTPGWSLDLTREDPLTGQPWDLGKKEVRQRVRRLVRDTAPFLLIGSPPCTMSRPSRTSPESRETTRNTRRLFERPRSTSSSAWSSTISK